LHIGDALLHDILGAEGRDRNGYLLDIFLAVLCRNDDFCQLIGWPGTLRALRDLRLRDGLSAR
jgi:hypothetical protein